MAKAKAKHTTKAKTAGNVKPVAPAPDSLVQVIREWARAHGVTLSKPKRATKRERNAMLAACTAFKRIIDGFPMLAMDAHPPQELEADRKASNAQFKSEWKRIDATAKAELAALALPRDLGGLLRTMAEQQARDAACLGDESTEGYFRSRVEGQKYLRIREKIAAMRPSTREEQAASLDLLAEGVAMLDDGEFWASWVQNIRAAVLRGYK
jgi:hypothetical protein